MTAKATHRLQQTSETPALPLRTSVNLKMKLYCVVAVAVFVVALCSQAESQNAIGPGECCFSLYTKQIPPQAIKDYKLTHPGCTKKAVILLTVKNKKLCANPEDKKVQDIMDRLDDLFGTLTPPISR